MKQKLWNLLIALLGVLISSTIFVGLLERDRTVYAVIGILFALISASLWFVVGNIATQLISSHIKSKKKIKTNERQIELKVLYKVRNSIAVTVSQSFFTKGNLVDCVYDAIAYAKHNNYIICKMWIVNYRGLNPFDLL